MGFVQIKRERAGGNKSRYGSSKAFKRSALVFLNSSSLKIFAMTVDEGQITPRLF